jgi:hypothetical protein
MSTGNSQSYRRRQRAMTRGEWNRAWSLSWLVWVLAVKTLKLNIHFKKFAVVFAESTPAFIGKEDDVWLIPPLVAWPDWSTNWLHIHTL